MLDSRVFLALRQLPALAGGGVVCPELAEVCCGVRIISEYATRWQALAQTSPNPLCLKILRRAAVPANSWREVGKDGKLGNGIKESRPRIRRTVAPPERRRERRLPARSAGAWNGCRGGRERRERDNPRLGLASMCSTRQLGS